jgi:hypothetical protein
VTDTTACAICQQPIRRVDCPTGGWWSHEQHPADDHDAEPTARGRLLAELAEPTEWDADVIGLPEAEAAELLDAYRDQVLTETIRSFASLANLAPDSLRAPGLNFAIGVLMGLRDYPAARTAASEAQPAPECRAPHPVADHARCGLAPGHDGWHATDVGAWPNTQLPPAVNATPGDPR